MKKAVKFKPPAVGDKVVVLKEDNTPYNTEIYEVIVIDQRQYARVTPDNTMPYLVCFGDLGVGREGCITYVSDCMK